MPYVLILLMALDSEGSTCSTCTTDSDDFISSIVDTDGSILALKVLKFFIGSAGPLVPYRF